MRSDIDERQRALLKKLDAAVTALPGQSWRRKVVSAAQLPGLAFFMVSHGCVQKFLERCDAVEVALDPVLLVGHLGG